jgi:hypothetical protein
VQTYLLLAAARKARHNLFAFYNCAHPSIRSRRDKLNNYWLDKAGTIPARLKGTSMFSLFL